MHLRHRGLFIAYAPADAPTIAIAVAIEGGGYGASSAAPVARKVFDAWLLGKPVVPKQDDATAVDAASQPASPPDFSNVQGSPGAPQPAAAPVPGAPRR